MWDKRRQVLFERQLANPPRLLRGLREADLFAKLQEMIGYLSDRQVEELLAPPRLQEIPDTWPAAPRREWQPSDFNGKPKELIARDERLALRDTTRLLMLAVYEYVHKEREEAEKRLQSCQERLLGDWYAEGLGKEEGAGEAAMHID